MIEIINPKPLAEIREEKKKEIEKATAGIWEAIANMGTDLAEAQAEIEKLKNEIKTLKGDAK